MMIKDFLQRTLVVLLAVLATLIFFLAIIRFNPTYDFDEEVYTVEQGDCLWNIASKYCPRGMDMHEYIDLIKEHNGLVSNTIQPGQTIIVLIAVK